MNLEDRARVHAALGDPRRLQIVDALRLSDRTFSELARLTGLPGNAFAHHLAVLEGSGLVARRDSDGDRRRRYVGLRPGALSGLDPAPRAAVTNVLFVCSHNSARSQFAAGLWRRQTAKPAESAGADPAPVVHPLAVRAALAYDVDLSGEKPKGYDGVQSSPDLIVSVCDLAFEAGLPFDVPLLHWSIPDPVAIGTLEAFNSAFADVARRMETFVAAAA